MMNETNLSSKVSKQGANSASTNAFSLLSAAGVRQLASQLIQWRGLLPSAIQWPEDDPTSFPGLQNVEQQPGNIDPNLTSQSSNPALFTTNLDKEPTRYPYAYDIQVAILRTRYYYAKYMAYRPFVYKVLHFPELITREDAHNVAECLCVCAPFHRHHQSLTNPNHPTVLPSLANPTVPSIPLQTSNPLPLHLVPNLPWHPAHRASVQA